MACWLLIELLLASVSCVQLSDINYPPVNRTGDLLDLQADYTFDQLVEPEFELNFTEAEEYAISKYLERQQMHTDYIRWIDTKTLNDKYRGLREEGDNHGITEKIRKNKDKPVTVHVIPHSQLKVGGQKTIDEFYSGYWSDEHASASLILDQVLQMLIKDPERRFTVAEMKMFQMWFSRLSDRTKDIVRQLVWDGQLELVQGGWTTPDEACPNYDDMITNMYVGHQFIKREFGITSKIAWQLVAAGHSSAYASLLADFGFEALFITMAEVRKKEQLQKKESSTFLWRPLSKHFGSHKQILTIMYKNKMELPHEFGYDERNNQSHPIIEDPTLDHFNANVKAINLINLVVDMLDQQKNKGNAYILWGDYYHF